MTSDPMRSSAHDNPDSSITSPQGRAGGLMHRRGRIRRRASWVPLVFLVIAGIVVLVLGVLRSEDELQSTYDVSVWNVSSGAGRSLTHVTAVVTVQNTDDDDAAVVGIEISAGDEHEVIVESVSVAFDGGDASPVSDTPQIPELETATLEITATFECTAAEQFLITPRLTVEVRQNGLTRSFTEPNADQGNGDRYRCEEGLTLLVE